MREERERENKTTWGDQQQARESEEAHHLEGQTLVGVKRNWRNGDEAAKRQRGRFRGETGKSPRLKGEVAVLPVWVGLVCPLVPQYLNLCAGCRMQTQEVCLHRRNNRHSNRLSAFYCTVQDYAPLVHWEYFTWCQNGHTVTLQGHKKTVSLGCSCWLIIS